MRPLLVAGTLVVLVAGCGERPTAPVAPVAVMPPIDLLGTWTSQDGGGFVAIGARQVVVAVDGTPRVVAMPIENAIEPGMSAGRLGLAGGTVLYLARGSTLVNGLPVEHLDVEVVSAAGISLRRRLLADSGLRLAARVAAPAAPPSAAPAKVDANASFLAAVPAGRRSAAQELIARATAGASARELAVGFGAQQRAAFAAILDALSDSRTLPAEQAGARLTDAARQRSEAETYASAWRRWMAGRG